jgi:peptide/nickel transport system substrate-binding protein
MDRRDFVVAAGALGASLGLTGPANAAETPKRGGHLVIGLASASTTDSLDPGRWLASYPYNLGKQLYDCLTTVDSQLKTRPALAVSWDSRNGAKEWVFKLRKGVQFHNGKELTGADVVRSMNQHRGPNTRSAARSLGAAMADVKATDKYEVTFTLVGPNVEWPTVLTEPHLVIGPEETNFTDGIGTGPFVLKSFEPGVRAIATRNANDWRSDRGYVETVETLGINDPNARLAALLSGAVHLVAKIEATSLAALQSRSDIQVYNYPGGQHPVFAMFTDTAPFDNPDLRLALKYGIDRQAMLQQLLRGNGRLGNDHPIPTFDPLYAADIPQRQYDPEKAQFYIKKSGYAGSIELTIADTAFNGAIEGAQLFQANCAKAGINLQLNRVPNNGYWSNVWLHKPFAESVWGGNPTADLMLSTVYAGTSGQNETHWVRPRFDQLLAAGRAEPNVAKRKQIYHDLQFMLHEEGGAIIPVFSNFLNGASKKIRGFAAMPCEDMSGNRAAEKVWFA